jgi:hypothetical protein
LNQIEIELNLYPAERSNPNPSEKVRKKVRFGVRKRKKQIFGLFLSFTHIKYQYPEILINESLFNRCFLNKSHRISGYSMAYEKRVVKPSNGLIYGALGIPVTPSGCPVSRAKSASVNNSSKERIS